MAEHLPIIATWLSLVGVLGAGLVGGLLFAFSNFMMTALDRMPGTEGMRAMQRINEAILNPLFMGGFLGTTLAGVLSAVAGGMLVARGEAAGIAGVAAFAAGATYVVGVFVVTAARNVPLNEWLDTIDPDEAPAAEAWTTYRTRWLRWNHLRTICCVVSVLLHAAVLATVAS